MRAELSDADCDPKDSGLEIWRAISMTTSEVEPERLHELLAPGAADKLVLDAGQGGSGTSFDWARIPGEIKPQVVLAGGIGADNINDALETNCFGIDLNSGLEVAPLPATDGTTAGPAAAPRKDSAILRSIFNIIRDYTQPQG